MAGIPSGYTPLAKIGISDKGEYVSGTTYEKQDSVLYKGSTYVALIDNPVGEPTNDGVNWRYLAKGFPDDINEVAFTFTEAATRENIQTGEKSNTIMGKIKKWFAEMTVAAFAQVISSYDDMMSNTIAGYLVDALAVKAGFDALNSNLLAENGHYHGIMGYNKYSSKYYCLVPMPNYIIKNYNIACSEVNVGGVMTITNVYVDVSKSALSVQFNDTISTDLSGLWASAKLTFTAK